MQELKEMLNQENWDGFLERVKPAFFVKQKESLDTALLPQICKSLINETTPEAVKISCLKCLGNSCFEGYKYKRHRLENDESDEYDRHLYDTLIKTNLCEKDCDYPHGSYFPYDGVIKWTVNFVETHARSIDHLNGNSAIIYRLSIQFLCNLFTWAYENTNSADDDDILRYLSRNDFKSSIINSTCSDNTCLVNVACMYVHNALQKFHESYFTDNEKNRLCSQLLKIIVAETTSGSAKSALLRILYHSNVFEKIYSNIPSAKVDLLEIIYTTLLETEFKDTQVFADDMTEYLALTFCKTSDCILKTVDKYVDSVDCKEIMLILQILGILTLRYKIPKNARSLLITCKYLLMSLHMTGKGSNNYFTPLTKLSEVAPSANNRKLNASSTKGQNEIPEEHPAYAFKTGLIRIIANLSYKNKTSQDLFREIDGIPLLLDCCNIDARNPLILQWTILALRNLCEGNLENQEIIRSCKKEGVVDNSMLGEMGLTLHEDADGKSIRIAPLRRD